jgi:hypothetical protein
MAGIIATKTMPRAPLDAVSETSDAISPCRPTSCATWIGLWSAVPA